MSFAYYLYVWAYLQNQPSLNANTSLPARNEHACNLLLFIHLNNIILILWIPHKRK